MSSRISSAAAYLIVTLGVAQPASGQALIYRPVNPSFGGDPFNSSHLLGVAGAQNSHKDKSSIPADRSQADLFASQLQSRLLSALAGQVTEAIFGDNPQDKGTFTFGDQSVSFVRGLESISLTITNTATGAVTQITIPSYVQVK